MPKQNKTTEGKGIKDDVVEFCKEKCDSFYLVGIHRCSYGHCCNCGECNVLSELLVRLGITNKELTDP